jgi:hypothetical protein
LTNLNKCERLNGVHDRPRLRPRGRTFPGAILIILVPIVALADETGFEVVRPPPPAIRAGKRSALSLTLLPHAGHRLLAGAPVDVRLSAEGAALPRPILHREDAVDPHAEAPRFEVPIEPARAGRAHVTARCTFYLCKDARCRPVEAEVDWIIDVTP